MKEKEQVTAMVSREVVSCVEGESRGGPPVPQIGTGSRTDMQAGPVRGGGSGRDLG
ncbi:hypothetical protein GCM10009646_76490 [Streptomyces aureus]